MIEDTFKLSEETPSMLLARRIAAHLDGVARQAINNHLGREDWTFEEVLPRLALVTFSDSVVQTITMDGEPILSIAPVETEIEQRDLSTFACAAYKYQILNEKKGD